MVVGLSVVAPWVSWKRWLLIVEDVEKGRPAIYSILKHAEDADHP